VPGVCLQRRSVPRECMPGGCGTSSVPDPKHFGSDPDAEFDIRALWRFRICTGYQNVWRALVSSKFLTYKKKHVLQV
jgi:hypothetical protein